MTIGELSKRSGIPASTIRYWEKIGILPKPVRMSGRRRYSCEAVDRLAVLGLAQACGFRLEEIRRLLHGFQADAAPSKRWLEMANRKRQELDRQMARLNAMRKLLDQVSDCQCPDMGECGRIAAAVLESAR